MTASYEKLIEELYKSDKSKLESALESDVKEILNDTNMRNLLREFIARLDKDSNFEPNSMRAIRYFEVLLRVQSLEDFSREQEEIKCFCSREVEVNRVTDESSLTKFLQVQKKRIYRKVDDSHEHRQFKEYLKHKYQSRTVR